MYSIAAYLSLLWLLFFGASCASDKGKAQEEAKPALLWIDATANIERFNNKDTIDYYLEKVKDLGFTDIVVDLRPISGHVLYDSEFAPKLLSWGGKEINYTFDYPAYYIKKAHAIGLKVQASLNVFVAGHNYFDLGPIYEEGKSDWATIVYPPDEEVKLIPITEEKQKYSAMANPVNEEFRAYILDIISEVAEKYPNLDGIILDRVRYDGFTSDFSELSREKFEAYLGEELERFPEDIYQWKKNEVGDLYPERGEHFLKWMEWRASVIHQFMADAREAVKSVNPAIFFGTYTGAWYPTYFEVGVNFADKSYDPSKDFDWATSDYKNWGYANLLDLFTVGNYYTAISIDEYLEKNPLVQNETDMWARSGTWYCVEGSNHHLKDIMGGHPFLGGILADQFYDNPEGLTESIKMNLTTSDGLMIFDIVHIINKNMWSYVEKGMREAGAINRVSR